MSAAPPSWGRHPQTFTIGDVALMFKKREAANLGGLRYVFGQNLGLGQWAVVRSMVLIGNGEILETGGCETRTGAARKTKARWTLDVSRRAQARARKR